MELFDCFKGKSMCFLLLLLLFLFENPNLPKYSDNSIFNKLSECGVELFDYNCFKVKPVCFVLFCIV